MKNRYLTFILIVITLFSCNTKKQESEVNAPDISYVAPVITRISDLPDSLKPELIDLSERPEPRTVMIPNDQSSPKTYIGPNGKVQIKPPEKKLAPAFEGREEDIKKLKADGLFDIGKAGKPYYINYTTDDGLAANTVTCATVDKRGHIWFGTWASGISRFDGQKFTNYSTANGLTSNMITSILEDYKGNIWIGTQGRGLCRFNGSKFTSYITESFFAEHEGSGNIVAISEGKSGKIWMLTRAGIEYYNPETESVIHLGNNLLGLNNDRFRCVQAVETGNIWFGGNNGVICFDPVNNQITTDALNL